LLSKYEFTVSIEDKVLVYPHRTPSFPKKQKLACQKEKLLIFIANIKV